jgi:hypothetical protein
MLESDSHLFERYNYIITLSDLASLPYCKKGGCNIPSTSTIKALLYMLGMDVTQAYERVELLDEDDKQISIRSTLTDAVQTGGYIYKGYLRTDDVWKKSKGRYAEKYLFTDEGIKKLMKMIKKVDKKGKGDV